ncbi:MAG: AAA family ATPase [Saprospiraceae bacterium]|nr:AAA family ATPase [Saprospiraceae bacterium]
MRIDKFKITNFRCFQHLELELNPRLNVFVGVNGSGKSALLEALKLGIVGAIGEIKGAVPQKSTLAGYGFDTKKDPNIRIFERGEVAQSDIVSLEISGSFEDVNSQNVLKLKWLRSLEKVNIRYRHKNDYKEIQSYFSGLSNALQVNKDIELPLFAYYSTGRLFWESNDTDSVMNGERVKGYLNAPTAKSSQYLFKKWFEKREQSQEQYRKHNVEFDFSSFERVKQMVCELIPGCESIFFDHLRFKEVVFVFNGGQVLPYSMLSDGTRNLVALISDLALRCAVLNPWLGDKISEVRGVVLIDEVDLHLHPSWQRMVVPSLLKIFKNVQFFITTHSPMTLASLEPYIADPIPNIFILNKQGAKIDIEPLAQEIFGTVNQWLINVFGLAEPRSQEAETVILEAKQMLSDTKPSAKKIQQISEKMMLHLPAHDIFWIRWNYFAEQNGVTL